MTLSENTCSPGNIGLVDLFPFAGIISLFYQYLRYGSTNMLSIWDHHHHHHHHLSLNREGHRGTTDDFTTSFLHFSLFSTALSAWRTPGLSIPWCSLPTSSSVCLVFFPLSLCLARWFWPNLINGKQSWPYHCSLRLFAMIFVWFDCLLDLGTDFLFGNMVFVGNAYYFAVVHHFHGLFSFLQLCCEGPRFTSLQEDGCDKGAHQSYLGAERNTRVIPNWFQPCQCCCCLCYPGQCLRLGSLISRPQRDWQTEASLFFILFLSRLSKVFLFCFF